MATTLELDFISLSISLNTAVVNLFASWGCNPQEAKKSYFSAISKAFIEEGRS